MKEVLDRISKIKNNPLIIKNNFANENFDLIKNRIEDKKFKLVVVGEFSSGKSTFINALIGKDLLKHATIETTATVTYIYNVKDYDELYGKCVINFKNGNKKVIDDFETIKDYTTTISKENVAETIKNVEIYIHFLEIEEEIIIIDTPGLNGIADKHREITINEIQKAHACIYLCQKNGITDSDRSFIELLCNYQNTFIFIQNFIDELKKSENETIDDKLSSIKKFIEEKIIKSQNKKINYSLYGVSALKALVGKDYNISRLYDNDLFELTKEQRELYLEQSNIKSVEKKIYEILSSEENKKIRYKSICATIINLLENIILKEKEIYNDNTKLLKEESMYKDKEKMLQRLDVIERKKESIKKRLNNLLISQFNDKEKLLKEDINKNILYIEERINKKIEKETNVSLDKNLKNGEYSNILKKDIDNYNIDLEKKEYYLLHDIYKTMLSRLNEYCKYSIKNIKTLDKIKFTEIKSYGFKKEGIEKKEIVENLKKELIRNEVSYKFSINNIEELSKALKENEEKVGIRENRLKDLPEEKKRRIKELGNRPEKFVERYEEEEYEEERTGLIGWIFGNKKRTRQIPVYNDSLGIEWDRNISQISKSYLEEKEFLNEELDALKNKELRLFERLEKNKSKQENSKRQIEYLKKQIEIKEEELNIYETNAKREYLILKKKKLKNEIHEYLCEKVKYILINKVEEDMKKNSIGIIKKELDKELSNTILEEKNRLEAIISNNTEELDKRYKYNKKYIIELEEQLKYFKGEI